MTRRARLDPPGSGYALHAVSADTNDAALAVWARRDGQGHRAVRYAPGPVQAWELPTGPTPDFVQALPGGRLLVASGWARDLPEPGRQALIVDSEGSPVAAGELGNDVRHVLADAHGGIWVGYGDEGVYGASADEPRNRVSAHGLARFDGALRPTWAFPRDEADPIDDCYALTLTGGIVWCYYYAEFPITRIADGQVTAWSTEIEGAQALMVSETDDRACLVGDYDHPSLATIGALSGDAFRPDATTHLTVGHGRLSPDETHLITRGPTLHAFTGTDWHITHLDQLT